MNSIESMNSVRGKISGVLLLFGAILAGLSITSQPARAQTETVLYSFGNQPDGSNPYASLLMDKNGNLYSTTNKGGTSGAGTVFKVTLTGEESVLYSFGSGSEDGTYPDAGLIAYKGSLYGTTYAGGAGGPDCSFLGCGTVFKLIPKPAKGCPSDSNTGNGWCESVLYSFGSQSGDGIAPDAGLIVDTEGNLYGTTLSGGNGVGAVFELSPQPAGGCAAGSNPGNGWCETVLYSFGSEPDGANPYAGVILDKSGNLYGTTANGGNNQGTVFKLSTEPAGGCAGGSNPGNGWCETVLYRFGNKSGDGANPYGALVMDSKGDLYGTTLNAGAGTWGTVFGVTPTGEEVTLYSFGSEPNDGCNPFDGLIRDSKGNLYGTANACGGLDGGTVFELSPPETKGAAWTETILYAFNFDAGKGDGTAPVGGLLMEDGILYGTTDLGGANGNGTVFELTP
jgi:uncharacterized repeat protein (TIGR03803 family)